MAVALTLAVMLRTLRLARGLKLRDLALRSGLSIGYLSQLEDAVKQNPSYEVLLRLASALGVPGHALMPGEKSLHYLPDPAPISLPHGDKTLQRAFLRAPRAVQEGLRSSGTEARIAWALQQCVLMGYDLNRLAKALHQKKMTTEQALHGDADHPDAWSQMLAKATGLPISFFRHGRFEDAAD